MRWRGDRQSSNVEDRSGSNNRPTGKIAAGGGIGVFLIAIIVFHFWRRFRDSHRYFRRWYHCGNL